VDDQSNSEGSEQLVVNSGQPVEDSQTAAVILYDADAQQRIPFLIEYSGEQVEVVFVLDAQTDAALIAYDKQVDRRLVQADRQETGERNALETVDKSFEASVWLFKDRALSAEGFGAPGDDLPDRWQTNDEIMDDEERAAVIDSAYLAAQVMPLPIASPGKRLPLSRDKTAPSTIRLKALFEGNELILTHQMKQPTADQIATFKSIQKERWIVQGTHLNKGESRIPPKLQKLGALYKQLIEQTTGYKGRAPLHHQMLVVSDHLSREVEAVRKN
jgi:hypothetical protein